MKNNKGFSLVELIVVIAIMAILAAVAIPTFAHFIEKANHASDDQFIADVEYAVELANTQFGDETKLVSITCDKNTGISAFVYTVGDVTVTVTKGTDGFDAVAAAASGSTTATAKVDAIDAAAAGVIEPIDWTYIFKSKDHVTGYTAPTT